MGLQDLAIRAMNGMALVQGELRLEGDGNVALPRSQPGELIGVELWRKGFGKTSFGLYRKVQRGPDGLFSATAPTLTVEFAETVPGLFDLLARESRGGEYRLSTEEFRVVAVRFKHPNPPAEGAADLYADGSELNFKLAVDDRGIQIAFEALVQPSTRIQHSPVFRQAKLIGNLLIPAAYCRLHGSMLPILFPAADRDPAGDWHSHGPALADIPINSIGAPYCEGTLDWRDSQSYAFSGPFVELFLHEREFNARPICDLKRLQNGFATGKYVTDGPQLRINLGYLDWAIMLAQVEEAEIQLAGPGIGQVDGQTGRSVGECGGPMTQPIEWLRLALRRRPDGLAVEGRGELAPLASAMERSLGPELSFDFLIPRAWILARGIPLRGFWEDRNRDYPSDDCW